MLAEKKCRKVYLRAFFVLVAKIGERCNENISIIQMR